MHFASWVRPRSRYLVWPEPKAVTFGTLTDNWGMVEDLSGWAEKQGRGCSRDFCRAVQAEIDIGGQRRASMQEKDKTQSNLKP